MPHDQPLNRKDKKAQRDGERKKKGKKRKHEDIEEQQEDELQKDIIPLDANPNGNLASETSHDQSLNRKDKKAQRDAERKKKGKKRKHDEVEEQQEDELQKDFIPLEANANGKMDAAAPVANATSPIPETITPKPKKRKKSKQHPTQDGDEGDPTEPTDKSRPRFILFVGNLPYDTTDTSLQSHFKKLAPFTLRHRTDPKTKKSKGFAFLEFENYDRMKTCLKLYHHSMFDPFKADGEVDAEEGEGKKAKKGKGGRRINVELTAGGGGKNEDRKAKIKAKNVRLEEQRRRRAEAERKEKAEATPVKKEPVSNGGENDTSDIHPSRLARMNQ